MFAIFTTFATLVTTHSHVVQAPCEYVTKCCPIPTLTILFAIRCFRILKEAPFSLLCALCLTEKRLTIQIAGKMCKTHIHFNGQIKFYNTGWKSVTRELTHDLVYVKYLHVLFVFALVYVCVLCLLV